MWCCLGGSQVAVHPRFFNVCCRTPKSKPSPSDPQHTMTRPPASVIPDSTAQKLLARSAPSRRFRQASGLLRAAEQEPRGPVRRPQCIVPVCSGRQMRLFLAHRMTQSTTVKSARFSYHSVPGPVVVTVMFRARRDGVGPPHVYPLALSAHFQDLFAIPPCPGVDLFKVPVIDSQ